VVVTGVQPDSVAAEHGFETGDVILDVGGHAVSSPSDVRKAVHEAQSGGKHAVLMRLRSGDQTKFVAVPLGQG
jgi:serine protease Do